MMSDGYGRSSRESFANYDPLSSSWRTSQACLPLVMSADVHSQEMFLGTWPRSGTMRNGKCYRRDSSAHRNNGSGSSSWPTPTTSDGGDNHHSPAVLERNHGKNLIGAAQNWATATADDANNITRESGKVASLARDTFKWATPRAEDGERGKGSKFDGLPENVRAWATPAAQDSGNGSLPPSQIDRATLPGNVLAWDGTTASPSKAPTEPSGSSRATQQKRGLNPRFGLWLMGFPVEWLDFEP